VGQEIALPIDRPKLWAPDSPFLYNLRVELRRGAERADAVASYFGMRKVAIGPDDKGVTRILVNGKPVFQVGPLDQGFWPDGLYTAPATRRCGLTSRSPRSWGFNATRKHVKVEPERWYYWCDRLGLLVCRTCPRATPAPGAASRR